MSSLGLRKDARSLSFLQRSWIRERAANATITGCDDQFRIDWLSEALSEALSMGAYPCRGRRRDGVGGSQGCGPHHPG